MCYYIFHIISYYYLVIFCIWVNILNDCLTFYQVTMSLATLFLDTELSQFLTLEIKQLWYYPETVYIVLSVS
jgi:hypothetical protein